MLRLGSRRLVAGVSLIGSLLLILAMALRTPDNVGAQTAPGFVVVHTYLHDAGAFTEGLAFRNHALFEGTGLKGGSTLRRVDLTTGEVLRSRSLADRYFGEGVTVIDDHVFQLTWQDNKGWVYDRKTFERIRSFRYGGEGWGLTHNGRRLVMSNGTDVIRYRDPRTFRVTRELQVTDGGNPVTGLNELEWVEGEIFANVFPTDDVVRIDPHSGEVTGRLDLSGLHEQERNGCDPGVANGISYLPSQQRLFVTGKNWCNLYEIQPTDPPG